MPKQVSKAVPSETQLGTKQRRDYQARLFAHLPVYSTRLVRETTVSFSERYHVQCPGDVALILQDYFRDKDREEFVAVLLDTASTIIGLVRVSVGGLSSSIVEPKQVFKAAILGNAAKLLVAHNHPSGNPEPSREDVLVTKQLVEAGKLLGLPVLDHLIVTEGGFVSLSERGLID